MKRRIKLRHKLREAAAQASAIEEARKSAIQDEEKRTKLKAKRLRERVSLGADSAAWHVLGPRSGNPEPIYDRDELAAMTPDELFLVAVNFDTIDCTKDEFLFKIIFPHDRKEVMRKIYHSNQNWEQL